MSVATLASRGVGFVKVWVIAAVLGATYLGQHVPGLELGLERAVRAASPPARCRRCSCRPSSTCSGPATTPRPSAWPPGVLGLALAVMAVVSVVGIVLAPPIARLLSSGAPNAHVESQQIALSTFFLRFFIPQVLLYAVGTVATAVLFAKRRFVIVAVAPIANTVVLVATMAVFRIMHGPTPGSRPHHPERSWCSRSGARSACSGFVGVPTVALLRSGFRLRATPRRPSTASCAGCCGSRRGWRCNPTSAVLLGAALVMGNQVAGGVVAYQFCFVAFLAPRTRSWRSRSTPRSSPSSPSTPDAGDMAAFADRIRWGARRHVRSAAAGERGVRRARVAGHEGARGRQQPPRLRLFAAALASLGVGLFTYSTFLFFARGLLRAGRQPHARDHRGRERARRLRGHGGRRGSRSTATPPRSRRSASATARRTSSARVVLGS